MTSRRTLFKLGLTAAAVSSLWALPAQAQEVLKIGVNGVMSGEAASWGLVNKYCAETTADIVNAKGGIDIGGKKYKLEIVALDDKNDPKVSITNAEKLTSQGVKYIIGPNIDTTALAVKPVMERAKAMNFPYAFSKELYKAPANASVLGMVASYQVGPIIYDYLKTKRGVKSIAFLARNESDAKNQQIEGVQAAKKLGLNVVADKDSYEPGTKDFMPVMTKIIKTKPDHIVLSGVAPADAPLLNKAARDLGYKGTISTETGQDAKILAQVAGDKAKGFMSVGGASTPEIQSDAMKAYVEAYKKRVGEWNDEAGTKAYALEMILAVLQKNPAALTDVGAFKNEMATFSMPNPFVKGGNTKLEFTGNADFGRRSQVGVPLVVNEFDGKEFKPLFVGTIKN
ncbi:ABC transporter substrate-binding protein [Ottowia testudinis]|uniref:ABC transporter substrate-binding protein n=1 Tax=Ottowia testudinis TaxID=2816950 RepID=A0A975CIR5_9BURK|nr:ABC transporter substrate-binding protein [Ottowia testudinis]QTD45712.1 ABC transporter substrate-binding protein [Ottowia testudinis]